MALPYGDSDANDTIDAIEARQAINANASDANGASRIMRFYVILAVILRSCI